MLTIDIGWPPKGLWPNGRVHRAEKAKLVRAARDMANWLTREQTGCRKVTLGDLGDPVPIRIACHYSNESHRPDRDNTIAVCKPFFDGMADRLVIDDRHFREPTVEFVKGAKRKLVIQLGAEA